jgi:hypothetical protein
MGLDMYMYKVKDNPAFGKLKQLWVDVTWGLYFAESTDYGEDLQKHLSRFAYNVPTHDLEGKVNVLAKQVAYWRKANMIHNWLYTNCAREDTPDYKPFIVSREK